MENPQDVRAAASASGTFPEGFAPRDLPSVNGSPVDMVIVTTAAFEAAFQPLADWKTKKGVGTVIRTIEWIDANYPQGHDQPERIRLFLQDAYQKWGIWLVLMGGDYTEVPVRLAYNRFFFGGTQIPTDQYYACLEGDWNADGDELFGEGEFQSDLGDFADLYPDVWIGRAGVDDATEVATFVSKSTTYEKSPPANYVEKVCYLAEVLFPQDWEFGEGNQSITLDGSTLTDNFDLLVPGGWARTKCYQVTNTLDRAHAINQLNNGDHHLMTLMNHGDAFKFSAGNGENPLVFASDTDALTNGDHLMFVMATACNPNQFDLECQGESFMNNPNGGAVAVMGPTREDFPLSAAAYHEEMLELVFTDGVTRFGAMNQVHRVPFVSASTTDATPDRWTMLTKLLLGDPEIRFWTQEPADLTVTHVGALAVGASTITVNVTDGTNPVADALVCVSDANGTYSRALTDASGDAVLNLTTATVPGTVDVVATAPEFKPSETTFSLVASPSPVIVLFDTATDDDGSGASSGNGDGVVDAGETIELDVTARNSGLSVANTISVTASVEAGTSATFDLLYDGVQDASKVFIGPNRTNPAAVPFVLDFASPAIDYIGKPAFTFGTDAAADAGIFLWQDEEGWHLRWSSADAAVTVTGTVTTDGRVRDLLNLALENATDSASLNPGEDTLTLSGSTSSTDLEDGIDFTLADNTKLSIASANASFGSISPGATATGTVAYAVDTSTRGGQIGYVDLTFTDVTLATWDAVVPVVVAAPELEAWVFAVEDGVNPPVSGNGNGIIEVGETVRLTPNVLNRGNGAAVAVNGSASATGNITFVDAADAYGDLAPLGLSTGTDGYVFTVNDGTGTTIDLSLTDSVGRAWNKNIDFLAPATPVGLEFSSTTTEIVVEWDPNVEVDLAGYNVYGSATSGGPYTLENYELVRSGSRFVDSGVGLGATRYYQVTAVDASGNESPASPELEAWTTQPQVGGWPKSTSNNNFGGIAIDNADGDGSGLQEIYTTSKDFKGYGWQADGSTILGWPLATNAEVWATPALGDLDKDGDLEVLFGSNDSRFYVVNHDATPVYTDQFLFDIQGSGETMRGAPLLVDIDGDAFLEYYVGTDAGTVYGFNHDGTPVAAADANGLLYTAPQENEFPARIWGPMAAADMDGDGQREIAFSSWNDRLYVINPDGTDKPGFPKTHAEHHQNGPTLGDLDNDGTMEIVVGCMDSKIYAYNHDGTEYLVGSGGEFADLPGEIRAQIALCQLDADPELELVTSCMDGHLYAFNHDGTGFTQVGGLLALMDGGPSLGASASPIVVDTDGDGDMEILVGHRNGNFYGFHHDGSRMAGMPIVTSESIFATAAAGDLDNDGDLDVAFSSYDTSVNVLDFFGASTPAAYEWATFGGNNARTSVYGEPGPWQTGVDPSQGAAGVAFSLAQNNPNPFFAGTRIDFAVPTEQRVTLQVFNVEGRLVRTLVDGTVPAGRNAVEWDGNDTEGRQLSTGVYFYRLENGNASLTKKGVLLR